MVDAKQDIRVLSKEDLQNLAQEWNLPRFRADQIYSWLWGKGATNFEEMTNLDKNLRTKLSEKFEINSIEADLVQRSTDGTIKTRFRLFDNNLIESVLIPVERDKRVTACVSSQVGCSLSCKFCATGMMKRMRNLSPGEIYDQVKILNQQSQKYYRMPLTNIVYMGMGEPLLNYRNVLKSIELISSSEGLGFSPKRITISTAGIAKMMKQLADDNPKVNLALSLHAATDEKRNEIMPINEQNNLSALIEALSYYYQKTKNKISYEYITFQGFNDSENDAKDLIRLCKRFPVLINIIEYNPIPGLDFTKSDQLTIESFASKIRKSGVMVTVRKSRGKDIDAACGQLANREN